MRPSARAKAAPCSPRSAAVRTLLAGLLVGAAGAQAADAVPATAPEALSFRAPPPMAAAKWAMGNQQTPDGRARLAEFVPDGQRIAAWTELMTIQNYRAGPQPPSPERMLGDIRARQERLCPGATRWQVHASGPASVLYEWRAAPCQGWPDQHELATILVGRENLFIVRYTVKAAEMPAVARSAWLERLRDARIVAPPAR